MARVQLHASVRGHVTNDRALEFEATAHKFGQYCESIGLEVRGDGLSVELDEESVEALPPAESQLTGEEPA